MVLASPRIEDSDNHISNGHMLQPPQVVATPAIVITTVLHLMNIDDLK